MCSVCLEALLVVAAATAHADIIFSNVTSTADVNNTTLVCGASTLECPSLEGVIVAEAFTPVADYTMTDEQVLVAQISWATTKVSTCFCTRMPAVCRVRRSALDWLRPQPIPVR